MDIKPALKRQYHAALQTLRQTIEKCPADLWTADRYPTPFWQVAYHALFFTHLYLQQNEAAFTPWEHHREEYQFLGELPWPPHDPPKIGEPYTQAKIMDYWRVCDAMIDGVIDGLDLETADCGFWWYGIPKLDHEIMNIRHTQHHAAQLDDRLRAAGVEIDWVGGQAPAKEDAS